MPWILGWVERRGGQSEPLPGQPPRWFGTASVYVDVSIVSIEIVPLPWEKQWRLWLSGNDRSSSEPIQFPGSGPGLRIVSLLSRWWWRACWRQRPGRWRREGWASVKAGSLQGCRSPDQSINPSTNQSTNQSAIQSINQLINHSASTKRWKIDRKTAF